MDVFDTKHVPISQSIPIGDHFKTKFINSDQLPLVIEPIDKAMQLPECLTLLNQHNSLLKEKLLTHGGLLFRNFPIRNEHDFSTLIKNFKAGKFVDYIGGDSPRKKIREGIYTSTEAPPSIKIPLHQELSFVKNYPSHIYFYCDIAPVEKGETILADARKVFQALSKDIKQRFIEKNLLYISRYYYKSAFMNFINKLQPSHKSWIDVFETTDKQEVEKKCRENEFSFQWNHNDWLQISQKCPAVISHPKTHETVWFNQAHLFDFNPKLLGWWRYPASKLLYLRQYTKLHEVFFGDSTPIPREDLYSILDTLDQHTISFPWQKGDVLILDNILTMHGRAMFEGKRRVLVAMTN